MPGRPRSICLTVYIKHAWPSAVHQFNSVYQTCLAVRGSPVYIKEAWPSAAVHLLDSVYIIKHAWPSAVHLFEKFLTKKGSVMRPIDSTMHQLGASSRRSVTQPTLRQTVVCLLASLVGAADR
jgi:hypothetical protein